MNQFKKPPQVLLNINPLEYVGVNTCIQGIRQGRLLNFTVLSDFFNLIKRFNVCKGRHLSVTR